MNIKMNLHRSIQFNNTNLLLEMIIGDYILLAIILSSVIQNLTQHVYWQYLFLKQERQSYF